MEIFLKDVFCEEGESNCLQFIAMHYIGNFTLMLQVDITIVISPEIVIWFLLRLLDGHIIM